MNARFILITGCSGGGKSTLLDALEAEGYAIATEPGRRIVAEETAGSGRALPWVNMEAFANRAIAVAQSDLAAANRERGFVFFDRGLIDAAVGLQFYGGKPYHKTLGAKRHYARQVFLAPPWPEIYTRDEQRRHGFKEACEEFDRLEVALIELGYEACILPKVAVSERVNFVLKTLNAQ